MWATSSVSYCLVLSHLHYIVEGLHWRIACCRNQPTKFITPVLMDRAPSKVVGALVLLCLCTARWATAAQFGKHNDIKLYTDADTSLTRRGSECKTQEFRKSMLKLIKEVSTIHLPSSTARLKQHCKTESVRRMCFQTCAALQMPFVGLFEDIKGETK